MGTSWSRTNHSDATERLLAAHPRGERGYSSNEGPSRMQWKTTFALGGVIVCVVATLVIASSSLLQYVSDPSRSAPPYRRKDSSNFTSSVGKESKVSPGNDQRKRHEHEDVKSNSAKSPVKPPPRKPHFAIMDEIAKDGFPTASACKNLHLALKPFMRTKLYLNSAEEVTFQQVPAQVQGKFEKTIRPGVSRLALGACLNRGYQVPWTFTSSMETGPMETLLQNLLRRCAKREGNDGQTCKAMPRIFFVHVQNGLGNRLRALGSALAFANKTARELVMIWESDSHLQALYGDVFNTSQTSSSAIERLERQWPFSGLKARDKSWYNFDLYNYMLPDQKSAKVGNNASRHIYFKSAFAMNSTYTSWIAENRHLRELPVRDDIMQLVKTYTPSNLASVGGVHIRNRSLSEDIDNVRDFEKEYGREATETLEMWRSRTSYRAFVPMMKELIKNGTVSKFFVATDTIAVIPKLQKLFGKERIVYIPRSCDDRSAECVKYGMADILVLAKTKVFLGSTWSSFSEAAMRFGAPKALLAGSDFGIRTKPDAPLQLLRK